ncbi:hypothetical protein OHC33_005037 [Knufia fluminis]|uniref:Uncharacterized protein n=1 Tax=Knufia fluminis TaxID=191047 RepID=A0AAN8EKZ4_9EURO|nr:hypothetical protein OHC33_005037 [Knufia fluminis]
MECLQPISLTNGTHEWFKTSLNFTQDQWAELLIHGQETHKEMMICPVWSNIDELFSAIPSEQVNIAVTLLKSSSEHLFPEDLPNDTLLSALRSRLYLRRESWKGGERQKIQRKALAEGRPGQPNIPVLSQTTIHDDLDDPAEQENDDHGASLTKVVILKLPSHLRPEADGSASRDVDQTRSPDLGQQHLAVGTVSSSRKKIMDDIDTITVDVEGRKELEIAATTSTKTSSSLKRRREACDGCHKAKKRRCMHKEPDKDVPPQLEKPTNPIENADTFVTPHPAIAHDISRPAEPDTVDTSIFVSVDSTVPQNLTSRDQDQDQAVSDEHEPQHSQTRRPYSPTPCPDLTPTEPHWGVHHKKPLPSPPASDHCHDSTSDLSADLISVDSRPEDREMSVEAGRSARHSVAEKNKYHSCKTEHIPKKQVELEAEIQKLKVSLEEAQHLRNVDVDTLKTELAIALQASGTLRQDKSTLEQSLALQRAEVVSSQNDTLTLRANLEKEQASLKGAQEQIAILQQSYDFLKSEHKSLKASLSEDRTRSTGQEKQLRQLLETKRDHRVIVGDLRNQISKLQRLLNDEKQRHQQEVKDLETRNKTLLQSLNDEKKKQLKSADCDKTNMAATLTLPEEDTTRQKAFEQEAATLRTTVTDLERLLSEPREELVTHKQEAKTADTRYKSNMNKLRRDMVSARTTDAEKANKRIDEIQVTANLAQKEAEKAIQAKENLQAQLQASKQQAQKLDHSFKPFVNLYDSLILQHRKLSLEHEQLTEGRQAPQVPVADSLHCRKEAHVRDATPVCKHKSAFQHNVTTFYETVKHHEHYKQQANRTVIRWQRFYADLIHVFFKHIGEDFDLKRLEQVMRKHGIDRKVAREIVIRGGEWVPFVATASEDRCTDDRRTWDDKMCRTLPESAATARQEIEEAWSEGDER